MTDIELKENLSDLSVFFFFQAEDGIRDYKVTGVQTCALPISRGLGQRQRTVQRRARPVGQRGQPAGVARGLQLALVPQRAMAVELSIQPQLQALCLVVPAGRDRKSVV